MFKQSLCCNLRSQGDHCESRGHGLSPGKFEQPIHYDRNSGEVSLPGSTGISSFSDNVSYHRGKHNLALGAYFFHLAFNPSFPNNARGVYTYSGIYTGNAFADFQLFGYPAQGQVGIGEGAENAHTNWAHFYFQDGWQLTPSLKLDLGIRYEYNSNLVAGTNQTSNIDLSTGAARFVVCG